MLDNIRGVIIFKAEGMDLEKFINILREHTIICYDLSVVKGCLYGNIYRKDLKILKEIADKNQTSISIVDRKGAIFKAIPYKRRYGIVAGIIISLLIITLLSNTIIKIEYQGLIDIPEEDVCSLLNDNGLCIGKFIPALNYKSIERNVLISDDRIAWIGIRNIGGRVVVEIDEMVDAPYIIPKNIPCNIVADRDAQIIDAKVYSGKLTVCEGDGVKKDQLIVSGTLTDKRGKSQALHADAIIIGQYEEKVCFSQNYTDEIIVRSNDIISKNELQFFGFRFPLYIKNEAQNLECEYEENITYLSFFSSKIPIGVVHEKYIPFNKITVEYTEEEVGNIINRKIENFEQNLLEDKKIISKELQKNKSENDIEYVVLYTIQGPIGKNQEIF